MLTIKSSSEPYHASKWLSVALLVDANEMKSLLETLGSFLIYSVGSVVKRGEGHLHESFLSCYAQYVEALKRGSLPDDSTYRTLFAAVWTTSSDHLYALHVGSEGQLIRVVKPVIQLQESVDYSMADGKFRPMVFGKDSVLWGFNFLIRSYLKNPKLMPCLKWIKVHNFPTIYCFVLCSSGQDKTLHRHLHCG